MYQSECLDMNLNALGSSPMKIGSEPVYVPNRLRAGEGAWAVGATAAGGELRCFQFIYHEDGCGCAARPPMNGGVAFESYALRPRRPIQLVELPGSRLLPGDVPRELRRPGDPTVHELDHNDLAHAASPTGPRARRSSQ